VQEATLPGTRPSGVVGILLFPWLRSHQGEEGLQSGGKQSGSTQARKPRTRSLLDGVRRADPQGQRGGSSPRCP
jgi:hypothetical protein